jgi:hypothetical protein
LHDSNLRCAPVRADQNLQRHFSLPLRFPRLLRVLRTRPLGAATNANPPLLLRLVFPLTAWSIVPTIAHGAPIAASDGVRIARSW